MGRQPNQPVTGADVPCDALADPPVDVSGERITPLRVKFFDAMGEAHVAFLNEIEQFCAFDFVGVLLGDRNDQPQVAVDQFLVRPLTAFGFPTVWVITVDPLLNLTCQEDFLVLGQKWIPTNLLEVGCETVSAQLRQRPGVNRRSCSVE